MIASDSIGKLVDDRDAGSLARGDGHRLIGRGDESRWSLSLCQGVFTDRNVLDFHDPGAVVDIVRSGIAPRSEGLGAHKLETGSANARAIRIALHDPERSGHRLVDNLQLCLSGRFDRH